MVYKYSYLPAEQHPKMRPFSLAGALVTFTTIHPKNKPKVKARRIFTGINHLNQGTEVILLFISH